MKLNLADLAKEADSAFRDVQCSFGTVRVYHVPDAMLLSVRLNKTEPEIPVVRMETATGHQNRQAKKGDPEWDKYQRELAEYYNEAANTRNAAAVVLALKDIDWSEYDITRPPPSERAQEEYKNNWPDNEYLRKHAWLSWTIMFKRSDSDLIFGAIQELRGNNEPDEDMVDEIKKNSESSSKRNQKA